MPRVLIIYHSQQYGNTKIMAESVAEGIRDAGGEVELVNTNERRIDLDQFLAADAIALGTPDYFSYVAGTIKSFFDDLYLWDQAGKTVKGKPAVFFLSHGGGGKARDPFEALARRFFQQAGEIISATRPITEETRGRCRVLGNEFVKGLTGI
jgi:multimeric flavodoxin WrbA